MSQSSIAAIAPLGADSRAQAGVAEELDRRPRERLGGDERRDGKLRCQRHAASLPEKEISRLLCATMPALFAAARSQKPG
jgi:hypothetical protein